MCHAHTLQRTISLYYQMMTLLTFQHPDFSLKFYNGSPEMLPVISAGLYGHSTFKGRKSSCLLIMVSYAGMCLVFLQYYPRLNGHNLSKLRERVKDLEAWHVAVYGVAKSQTQLSD